MARFFIPFLSRMHARGRRSAASGRSLLRLPGKHGKGILWYGPFLCLSLAASQAIGQTYPEQPVRLIVPYSAGGIVDAVGRLVASALAAELNQPVSVLNRSGAGGSIGTMAVINGRRDGYTIGIGTTGPLAINPVLYRGQDVNLHSDITAIALIGTTPQMLFVHPSVPASSLQALIAHARAHPGQLSFASPGVGSSAHLAGELFKAGAGIDMVHVAYRGNREALNDVLAGRVHALFSPLATALPHVQAGRLRLLAVSGKNRSPLVPMVPTMGEAGVAGAESVAWYGVIGPSGLSKPVIERLQAAVSAALGHAGLREHLLRHGVEPEPAGGDQFAALIRAEQAKWRQAIRQAGISTE